MYTLTESVPNWSGTLKLGKVLVKQFFFSHSMGRSAKVIIHASNLDLLLPSRLARPGNMYILPCRRDGFRDTVGTESNRLHTVMLQPVWNVIWQHSAVWIYPSVSAWCRCEMKKIREPPLTQEPTSDQNRLTIEGSSLRKIRHSHISIQ
jgi:hypothetical protein